MDLLFNKSTNGQEEITKLLGFLSTDFSYDRLETDIELNTPDLIDIISEAAYTKIYDFYKKSTTTTAEKTKFERVLKLSQLYIAIRAYHDFSANNDLMHSTAGRKMNKAKDETTPWDWQIESDNAALMKRAYKVLDQLILALDKSELQEWLNSEHYKTAKELFVNKTAILDGHYPINKSEQLYYRLVPFMKTIELTQILPRIGKAKYEDLKTKLAPGTTNATLSSEDKQLLPFIELPIVYLVMAQAYKLFPVEMLPLKINYRENTTQKSKARAAVMLVIEQEAAQALRLLEKQMAEPLTTEEEITVANLDPMAGLSDNAKYVDL